ncbi:MAG: DUF3667 domain-containing protein [Flavobacteriaceae bacterium]|nr:DUF3667 domain-containing protein [Flavobacteriaceae bacterium]
MTNPLPQKFKGRKAEKYRGPECLNCGHPLKLSDVYCSYCGQLNTTKNLSLKDFFGEFIGSIITYDSRFRYTLKDLLFKPGVITRNYVHGQRLKYANPFRFFLSVSIIYFLLQGIISSFTGESQFIQNTADKSGPNFELKKDGDNFKLVRADHDTLDLDSVLLGQKENLNSILNEQGVNLDSMLANEGVDLDSILSSDEIVHAQDVDSIFKDMSWFKRKKDTTQSYEYYSEEDLDTLGSAGKFFQRFILYRNFYKTTNIKDPNLALDSLKHNKSNYNRWAYQKNEAFEQIEDNPREFATYLLEKTPFFVFFFAPIYALFFWLIYSKKKHTYMEHMIFIFHIFSFVFLASLICLIPDTILGNEIFVSILYLLIGPFYFYKALRNFYKQNRLITIIKFIFLNWVFFISATISAALFFAVTAAMY